MELVKVGEKTYFIKNPTNVGVYKIDENNVYLIDTGNDKDAGKKILKTVRIITKILGMIFLIDGLIFYFHITLINKQFKEVLKKNM